MLDVRGVLPLVSGCLLFGEAAAVSYRGGMVAAALSACPAACPPDPIRVGSGRVGRHGLEIAMAVCLNVEVGREPVGKWVKAAVVLADDPGGNPVGRLL